MKLQQYAELLGWHKKQLKQTSTRGYKKCLNGKQVWIFTEIHRRSLTRATVVDQDIQ